LRLQYRQVNAGVVLLRRHLQSVRLEDVGFCGYARR
jgi:hypothetical protein